MLWLVGWLLGCFLCSLIVVCDFCFALLDCCVNSVVFMIYVCALYCFDVLDLIVYWRLFVFCIVTGCVGVLVCYF